MVQMVFVHGVTVRSGDAYDKGTTDRDRRFAMDTFAGKNLKIRNPYWGKHGAPDEIRCIPNLSAPYVSLGLGNADDAPDIILQAARVDFPAVVGGLSAAAIEQAEATGDAEALANAEKRWAAAATYAERAKKQPAWLQEISTDEEFFARLGAEAKAQEGFADLGLSDDLKNAANALRGGFSNLVNGPFAKIGRDVLTPRIAIFIGDVFKYLKGEKRDSIRNEVLADVEAAARAAHDAGEKLVLVGHSMGAVILYDMLSDKPYVKELETRLGFPLRVDLFLSVGSQIAVFEEMKVFESSVAGAVTPKPDCVQVWWNVFDKMDVLSFVASPVFSGVEDFAVDTIAGVKDAHGAYFSSMVFYKRLAKRLQSVGLVS
jgi:hypothetical protein